MHTSFLHAALAQIPVILTLQDRNPHSPTYGCFDRNFWHYKIIDFPSGMSQEFVFPLALAFHADSPDNPFHGQEALRQWIAAGIRFAADSGHKNGSCDDYFPYECAGGAAAFSLLACMESYRLMNFSDQHLLDFFETRANWLARHHESGRLSNHQALIALCLELAGQLLNTDQWETERQQRLEKVLSWQDEEGWFYEYEGCDTGYLTLTLGCLAQCWLHRPEDRILASLRKGIAFLQDFIHPDGSFGGEYTSRNTYNYFPHGFELIGSRVPEALALNDRFLAGLNNKKNPAYGDDHIIGHHTWSYLLAWKHFNRERPPLIQAPKEEKKWYPNAGILIDKKNDTTLYLALNKGGVFKLFHKDSLICSDTQFSLVTTRGKKTANAVAHLVGEYDVAVEDDHIMVSGTFGWAKQKQMTPLNLIILRLIMYGGGRLYPDLVRKLLQKLLITGKQEAPFSFIRKFQRRDVGWKVSDTISAASWKQVQAAGMGGHQTSIYVVMSRTYQAGQLQPWTDYTAAIKELEDGCDLQIERLLPSEQV